MTLIFHGDCQEQLKNIKDETAEYVKIAKKRLEKVVYQQGLFQ